MICVAMLHAVLKLWGFSIMVPEMTRAISWSSTRSWTSSTVTVWPDSMHSSVTLSEAKRISRSVRRSSSGTSMLALRMAFSIFATSNVTSEPLRLIIFMCSLPLAYCLTTD
jgi:hypothetical protein